MPDCWFITTCPRLGSPFLFPCVDKLWFFVSYSRVTLSLAGRPFVELGTAASCPVVVDPYIDPSRGLVDVWGALNDGVWSSSTTIVVKMKATSDPGYGEVLNVRLSRDRLALLTGACNSRGKVLFPPIGAGCPSDVVGTVTIYDDGSFALT